MQIREPDQKILDCLAEANKRHPELRELLAFYERLFSIQFAFKSAAARQSADHDREIKTALLATGAPQVTFDDLNIKLADFIPLFTQVADILGAFFPDREKPHAGVAPELLMLKVRSMYESRKPFIESGAEFPMSDIAAGLSLMPYLQLAGEAVLMHLPPDTWRQPWCPVCGGMPSFAALARDSGARSLLCSRCSSVWHYDRLGCPFCEADKELYYYISDDERYRLYVCDACRRYLKTIDLRATEAAVCLPVESLITIAMDIAAREKGYHHC